VVRWMVVLTGLLAGAGCGGGGDSAVDTGGEAVDVSHDAGDTPQDAEAESGDVGGNDGGMDGEADDGADLPEASKRSVLTPTSGGGTARGGSYILTLTIGTPQPMGRGSNAGYRGALGPAAVLGQ